MTTNYVDEGNSSPNPFEPNDLEDMQHDTRQNGDALSGEITATEQQQIDVQVSVTFDGVEKVLFEKVYTTEHLKEELGVEVGSILNVVDSTDTLKELDVGEEILVQVGMKFISHTPAGGSS